MKNSITKVWQKGVEDEVVRQRQEMIRKIENMVKNQIPEVWQEGVDDEGGEEREAVNDKEDREDGEEPDTKSLAEGSRR